ARLHHRRPGTGQCTASVAAGIHGSRCVPVRLLHARPDLFRGRAHRRGGGAHRRRDPRAHERQYLPLRRLSQDPGGHRTGDVREVRAAGWGGGAMNNFAYTRASDVADAVRQIAADPAAKFIAGGTNLIDLMKENVARPSRVIDITHLPLNRIEEAKGGGLRIGALVPNSDLAYHPQIAARYPLLASALLAGASAQLRNMAS